jgi:hypothetical protein
MQGRMYPSERGSMRQKYRLAGPGSNGQIVAGELSCELRFMIRPGSDDVTVYLVLNDFGDFRLAYVETDMIRANRETIIRGFVSGLYGDALRVVAFNVAEGWSRDVSEEIAVDLLDLAFNAEIAFAESTKRFIDRHVTPGEKRQPAPSVRRGQDQAIRRKA